MRLICALLLTGILAAFPGIKASAADHPPKVALVIGNAKYPDNDSILNDAANDAQDVADELKRDGFDVEKGINLSGEAMRQALDRLDRKIEPGSVALLFFDGFAIQSARRTYLLPVDAQIWTEPDVARDGFNLETILDEMNNRGASIKIALLDAARRNPFERRFRRYSAGLAPAVTPTNTLVLYSSALGSVVTSSKNDHSLFVTELLREIRAPGVSAEQALRNTQAGVISASNREQVPWLSSSLTSDFSFAGPDRPSIDSGEVGKSTGDQIKPVCEAPKPLKAPAPDEMADDPMIKELSHRLAVDPNDQAAHYKRGQVYAIKRAYALAVQDFNETIRLNPRDAEAYNNRCWTRAALGDLQAALSDCDMALQLEPGLIDALDSRGLVNLKLGNYAAAIRDYSHSIEINPRSVSSLFGRGIAKLRGGGEGSADLALAKSMDPSIGREFSGYGVNECTP